MKKQSSKKWVIISVCAALVVVVLVGAVMLSSAPAAQAAAGSLPSEACTLSEETTAPKPTEIPEETKPVTAPKASEPETTAPEAEVKPTEPEVQQEEKETEKPAKTETKKTTTSSKKETTKTTTPSKTESTKPTAPKKEEAKPTEPKEEATKPTESEKEESKPSQNTDIPQNGDDAIAEIDKTIVGDTLEDEGLSDAEKKAQAKAVAKDIAYVIMHDPTITTDIERIAYAARFVHEFVKKGHTSSFHPDRASAYGTFVAGYSNCAGSTRAMGMVLECMGFKWKHVNENKNTHQWCIVYGVDGKTGFVDGSSYGIAGYGSRNDKANWMYMTNSGKLVNYQEYFG